MIISDSYAALGGGVIYKRESREKEMVESELKGKTSLDKGFLIRPTVNFSSETGSQKAMGWQCGDKKMGNKKSISRKWYSWKLKGMGVPAVAQQVKDPALLRDSRGIGHIWASDLVPGPGTSITCRHRWKRKKKEGEIKTSQINKTWMCCYETCPPRNTIGNPSGRSERTRDSDSNSHEMRSTFKGRKVFCCNSFLIGVKQEL